MDKQKKNTISQQCREKLRSLNITVREWQKIKKHLDALYSQGK